MPIEYHESVAEPTSDNLHGFFFGWPAPPTVDDLLAALRGSAHVVLARDTESGRVVGFVNALSDGVLSAFIALLEVLPEYQGQGIGTELMSRMLALLRRYRTVDLLCDPDVQPFYERLGMLRMTGMCVRNVPESPPE